MATDTHGRQPVRTINNGDLQTNLLDSLNSIINPAKEDGNLATINTRVGDTTSPAAGTVNAQLASVVAEIGATSSPASGTVNAQLASLVTQVGATSTPAAGTVNKQLADIKTDLDNIAIALGATASNPIASFQSDDLAGGATANHDYVNSSGGALPLRNVVCGSTQAGHYEVQVSSGGGVTFATYWVGFTSEAMPSFIIDCGEFKVPNGETVRVIRTNLSADVTAYTYYTTINIS